MSDTLAEKLSGMETGPAVAGPEAGWEPIDTVYVKPSLLQRIKPITESKIAMVGLAIVIGWVLVAILAPIISPYSPTAITPFVAQPPTRAHLLGTDGMGRDTLARLIWGSQLILLLAPGATLGALIAGTALGLVAGYFGGLVDEVIMRLLDALLAFPSMLLYLIIIASVGASITNIFIALTIGSAPGIARIVRSLVLDIRNREFVAAARLRGERSIYTMFVEILPNAKGPLIVDGCLRVGYTAFAIGTLGFLGLGTPPPTPDWGRMVNEGRNWIMINPWMVIFPSLAISSLVVSLNLIADGVREVTQKA